MMNDSTTAPVSGSHTDDDVFASELQQLLQSLLRNYEACERCCVSQNGVSVAQGSAILAFPRDDAITMRELSDAAGLAQSTMTRTVDQLVAKDLARRSQGVEDRREVLVELTPAGIEARQSFEAARAHLAGLVRDRLPASEREAAVRVLQRLNEAVGIAVGECGF